MTKLSINIVRYVAELLSNPLDVYWLSIILTTLVVIIAIAVAVLIATMPAVVGVIVIFIAITIVVITFAVIVIRRQGVLRWQRCWVGRAGC